MIITSALLLVKKYVSELNKELKACSAAAEILKLMHRELSVYACTIPELLERCSKSCVDVEKLFFCSLNEGYKSNDKNDFSEIWSSCAKTVFDVMPLNSFEAFCGIGSIIGRISLEMQLEEIIKAASTVEDEYNILRVALMEKRKVGAGCILSACAMLLIILT